MSAEGAASVVCANPDCNIAVDGKCVEGMEREKCPHFGRAPQAKEQVPSQTSTGMRLAAGIMLNDTEATSLLRRRPSRVVAMIAPSEAGKTSLIASVYDLFQNGPVGTIAFRGSKTLRDFELVCHDARAASRRGKPHTERTKRGEVKFFHLDVVKEIGGEMLTLILADRAGEDYRTAIDDTANAEPFIELRRCDVLSLLIDGSRLRDSESRHNVKNDAQMLIQAMAEQDIFAHRPRLAVVLTKLDLVDGDDHRDRVHADFDSIVSTIRRLHGDKFSEIETHKVAASPQDGTVARGTGMANLLAQWLKSPPRPISVTDEVQTSSRAFGRLERHGEVFGHE